LTIIARIAFGLFLIALRSLPRNSLYFDLRLFGGTEWNGNGFPET
jgi:hypothetical protein